MSWRWRSPLAGVFGKHAEWCAVADSDIVEDTGSDTAMTLGFCDLSPLPRLGAKGDTEKRVPNINHSAVMKTGSLCCRLSADEFLLLAAPDGTAPELSEVLPKPRLLLPRRDSHCCLGLCGWRAPEMLSLLCAVAPPEKDELLQTRVAEIGALVIRDARTDVPAFNLLVDSGYAMHLWDAIRHAATARNGSVIGWRQWRELFS